MTDQYGQRSILSSCFPEYERGNRRAETQLRSMDHVIFHVRAERLHEVSRSTLNAAATPDGIIDVPEQSEILHIILHGLYRSACAINHPRPTLDLLSTAVDHMPYYGITVPILLNPRTPLYALLVQYSFEQPMEVFALAAHHRAEALAVECSKRAVAVAPTGISDSLADKMGPVYLRRILVLHEQVVKAYSNILLMPPNIHSPCPGCDMEKQAVLSTEWRVVAGTMALSMTASDDVSAVCKELMTLEGGLDCGECQGTLRRRVEIVAQEWVAVKRTI